MLEGSEENVPAVVQKASGPGKHGQLGLSPVDWAFRKYVPCHSMCRDGVIDSFSQLIHCANFIKPWSDEYLMSVLWTKAF